MRFLAMLIVVIVMIPASFVIAGLIFGNKVYDFLGGGLMNSTPTAESNAAPSGTNSLDGYWKSIPLAVPGLTSATQVRSIGISATDQFFKMTETISNPGLPDVPWYGVYAIRSRDAADTKMTVSHCVGTSLDTCDEGTESLLFVDATTMYWYHSSTSFDVYRRR